MASSDRQPDLLYMSVAIGALGAALQWLIEIACAYVHVLTG